MADIDGKAADSAETDESLTSTEAVVEETTQVESEGADEASAEEAAKPESGAQKRIRELTWQRHEAERREKAAAERIRELEKQVARPAPTANPVAPDPQLALDDPATYRAQQGEYTRAVARQVAAETRAEAEQDRQQSEAQKQRQAYSDKLQAAVADDPQLYERLRAATFELTPAMTDVLVTSDKPIELTRYLAEHPEEGARIEKLSPLQAAREMGRIEARLEAIKPTRASNAPDPMQRPRGNERVRIDPDKLSVDEWKKWREAQIARKAKG